jgi:hypothetical protein
VAKKRKPIPARAWRVPAHAGAGGRGAAASAFVALAPQHRVGDGVSAAVDIPYPDVIVPAGTTGVVTFVTEFGNEIFYFVVFDGDTLERLAREAQLR